jgi:DNA (cytosine-5)-methyltransferase 1
MSARQDIRSLIFTTRQQSLERRFDGELIVDNFAGGGGTSPPASEPLRPRRSTSPSTTTPKRWRCTRSTTRTRCLHLCEDVWEVDPIEGHRQPARSAWCGCRPTASTSARPRAARPWKRRFAASRGCAALGRHTKPRVVMLENVEEFQEWGPLIVDADGNGAARTRRRRARRSRASCGSCARTATT